MDKKMNRNTIKKILSDIVFTFIMASPFLVFILVIIIDTFVFSNNEYRTYNEVKRLRYVSDEYDEYNPSYSNIGETHEVYSVRTVAYCSCEKCCGWNTGITYSGTVAAQGRTVAANLDKFPIGTRLMIDGHEYIVEDTGNLSEYTIDIYFDSHEEALKYGSQWKIIEITKNEK